MRLALLAFCCVSAFPAAAQGPSPNDAVTVRAAFDAILSAIEARDVSALERLVHPAFEMQHGLGQSDGRAAWLALVASGRLARQTAERREVDPTVIVVGDTALIRSLVRLRDTKAKRDTWMRATAAFGREGGRWVQVNQQSTLLRDGPIADLARPGDFAGRYAVPGRDGFLLEPHMDHLALRWTNGAVLPLVPEGFDRFASGPGSIVTFARDAEGMVTGATRTGSDGRAWWTATRAKGNAP